MAQAVLIHEDPEFCNAIQARLERLYIIDGRDKRDHPQYHVYTGLAEKYRLPTTSN
jgi:heat shock protein HspQ